MGTYSCYNTIIEIVYTKGYKSTGRPSYDSLVLSKIELLRTWYGLSDGEVEDLGTVAFSWG